MQRLRAFHHGDEGQNLVEFALLLPILMYILMGIMQFGLIFAVYLTLNNAVREGARWASIYIYDNSLSNQAANDAARNDGLLDRLVDARGILVMNRSSNTSNFSASTTWTSGTSNSGAGAACLIPTGVTLDKWYDNGDTLVCYEYTTGDTPTGDSSTDAASPDTRVAARRRRYLIVLVARLYEWRPPTWIARTVPFGCSFSAARP